MLNNSWIEKLKIDCIEQGDGCLTIQIEWDETDPELEPWTKLGEEGQRELIFASLNSACVEAVGEELTGLVD
jgi:hypothetical protein